LWGVPGVSFVSLQKGHGEQDAAGFDLPLQDLGPRTNDFADLAALVQLLDLVICVDTAVAHVAGALGKPCWVLLPARGCDWRWFAGDKASQAAWYPQGVQLVHQPPGGDWTPALHALAVRLIYFLRPVN
jgi:ADP-heptose:LPS heptosyltransferase